MSLRSLPYPVKFENAFRPVDAKSALRILLLLGTFLLSFGLLAAGLRYNGDIFGENLLVMNLILGVIISLLFYLVIFLGSLALSNWLPAKTQYRITEDKIEILERNVVVKSYPNKDIQALEPTEGYFKVIQGSDEFLLPRMVHVVGTGLKFWVIPFTAHTGLTFLLTLQPQLNEGQIRIVQSWMSKFGTSRYPN